MQEFKTERRAVLTLVDLAGSERSGEMGNTGQRLKEGAAINKSLLVLGTVVNLLSEGKDGGSTTAGCGLSEGMDWVWLHGWVPAGTSSFEGLHFACCSLHQVVPGAAGVWWASLHGSAASACSFVLAGGAGARSCAHKQATAAPT